MGPSFTRPRFATVVYHNGPCNKSGIPENEALPRKQGWGRAVCKSHTTPREQPFTRGGGRHAFILRDRRIPQHEPIFPSCPQQTKMENWANSSTPAVLPMLHLGGPRRGPQKEGNLLNGFGPAHLPWGALPRLPPATDRNM